MAVPATHVRAIDELARRGVAVLAATSRRARVVRPCLEQAGLSLPAVLVDGALGVDFRNGKRFHQAVFSLDSSLAALEAFRSANLEPCVYVDDPDLDVLIAETPSTCPAHLASLGSFSRAEDISVGVVVRPVYAFCWRFWASNESGWSRSTPFWRRVAPRLSSLPSLALAVSA